MTIYKYGFPIVDDVQCQMPKGARVLCVQAQHGFPQMWALVDPQAPMEIRHFKVFGTGHPVPEKIGKYIGTFQINNGTLVFHLFERDDA